MFGLPQDAVELERILREKYEPLVSAEDYARLREKCGLGPIIDGEVVAAASELLFCECTEFKVWYESWRWRVCQCGHRSNEHINDTGTCLGDVEVSRGRSASNG